MKNLAEKICKERASQYGSYKENMELVYFIKTFYIKTLAQNFKGIFGMPITSKPDRLLFFSSIDFALIMLSLKAVRSLKATGDSFKDCIIDFINYKNLTEEVLHNLEGLQNERIFNFDTTIFNPILNSEEIKFEEVKWLVDTNMVFREYETFKDCGYDNWEFKKKRI